MQIVLKFNDSVLRQIQSDKTEVTIGSDPENYIQINNISSGNTFSAITS